MLSFMANAKSYVEQEKGEDWYHIYEQEKDQAVVGDKKKSGSLNGFPGCPYSSWDSTAVTSLKWDADSMEQRLQCSLKPETSLYRIHLASHSNSGFDSHPPLAPVPTSQEQQHKLHTIPRPAGADNLKLCSNNATHPQEVRSSCDQPRSCPLYEQKERHVDLKVQSGRGSSGLRLSEILLVAPSRAAESGQYVGNPSVKKKLRAATANRQVSRCQAEGCKANLSSSRDYHRRHRVCEWHSKANKVRVLNTDQRFCQQCSRFHAISEFDEGKRSCRKRLECHNLRRRKNQQPLATPSYLSDGKFYSTLAEYPLLQQVATTSSSSSSSSSVPMVLDFGQLHNISRGLRSVTDKHTAQQILNLLPGPDCHNNGFLMNIPSHDILPLILETQPMTGNILSFPTSGHNLCMPTSPTPLNLSKKSDPAGLALSLLSPQSSWASSTSSGISSSGFISHPLPSLQHLLDTSQKLDSFTNSRTTSSAGEQSLFGGLPNKLTPTLVPCQHLLPNKLPVHYRELDGFHQFDYTLDK